MKGYRSLALAVIESAFKDLETMPSRHVSAAVAKGMRRKADAFFRRSNDALRIWSFAAGIGTDTLIEAARIIQAGRPEIRIRRKVAHA